MKPVTGRRDLTSEELEALLDGAREALGEAGYQKLQAAIRTLGYVTELLEAREATLERLRRLLCHSRTEKTEAVLQQAGIETGEKKHKVPGPAGTLAGAPKSTAPGHGRNGAAAVNTSPHKLHLNFSSSYTVAAMGACPLIRTNTPGSRWG